ncbi:MAG: carotenoid oxygenase family protein [Acidimicrobiales bacterium]
MTVTDDDRPLPFHLRGNYAPVFEEVTETELTVEGQLPAELTGLYVRNGANPKTGRSPHWFAGDGMLHGVRIDGGNASWYRNRWVRTKHLDDPKARQIGPDGSVDRTIGVNNTHIVRHAGKILSLVESSFPCEMTPELDTVGVYDFDGRLDTAMTAHPKICALTGEMHFFGYGFFPPYLTYHRVSADGELVQSEVIDVAGPTMIHDFSITEHHVLFMDLPVVFDLDLAMKGGMPYRWDDDYAARVGVMPRGGTGNDVRWFDVDPCYVFHPMNSFEQSTAGGGTSIVVDTARYPDLWRADSAKFNNDAALHRWTLDLDTGSVAEEPLDDRLIEFPRVHDDLVGLVNRYGYAVATEQIGDSAPKSQLVKYDLESGASEVHDFGTDRITGEAVFVPAEAATSEDEGWLMSFVYDKPSDTSALVVLDATNVAAEPVATVQLPRRVPFGFHGSWFTD